MADEPLDVDYDYREKGDSLTFTRVVVIATIVALVVGCLPALGTALVVASNNDTKATQRSYDNCVSQRDARKLSNDRLAATRINLEADVKLFTLITSLQPKKLPADYKGPLHQSDLDRYNNTLAETLSIKRDKVLPSTKELPLQNCEKIYPDAPEKVPLNRRS